MPDYIGGALPGTDRYGGGPYPDPATMCPGDCDGMGRYPVRLSDASLSQYEREQWAIEEANNPVGEAEAHFIVCPTCGGTGKRKEPPHA